MSETNTKVLFKSVPEGAATVDNFDVVSEPFDLEAASAALTENKVLLKITWLSVDPYMRGRMRKADGPKSYSLPFSIGEPFAGHGVGIVVKSKSPKYVEGDAVVGFIPWGNYVTVSGAAITRKINIPGVPDLPHETYLGLLGMPSFTAYVGLIVLGKPKAGETLFVSAAAGAVGQVVGQIGKRLGLRVVGSAGSDEKVNLLVTKFGFDAAFNYNKHTVIREKLAELCPNGIDIYFENVGGATLDAVFTLMNVHGRIPMCGMISQYNGAGYGIKNLGAVISKRITIQGFIQSDYLADHNDAFFKWMFEHGLDGTFAYEQTVANGIENIPNAFIGMMEGKNVGKQLIKL
ncbi:hypothetical protein HK100_000363 [Physocladia obscura]|uniref:Enoyl reductase (ER) domain-containing protein n=1 Tax=Physocladia obscura TaxID=109957 RepID=A0AAD5XH07_9FUNG|nr:hypothetical protein HK100_000363 [Physocladia obscura]